MVNILLNFTTHVTSIYANLHNCEITSKRKRKTKETLERKDLRTREAIGSCFVN